MTSNTRLLLMSLLTTLAFAPSFVLPQYFPSNSYEKWLKTYSLSSSKVKLDPEAKLDFCGIANYHGYDCEEFYQKVETQDGFLLTVHRITGRMGAKPVNDSSKPPVFVQHGLLGDSTMWVLNPPNETLPFLLSDAGYDVWMGNSRGNTYSRAHKWLKPDTDEFWAWSWDEMAQFDLPASIDFVLKKTGYEKLHYIGHSQGTLIAFVHLATSNASKISHMIALGPVFNVAHMTSPIRYISPIASDLAAVLKLLGLRDFLPSDALMRWVADVACPKADKLLPLCGDILMLICGVDNSHLNESRIPVYINHAPAGTSVRDIVHFAQMVNTGTCSRFDYGSAKANKKHYGQAMPPAYDIRSIKTPISLMWAERDALADPKDVQYIIENVSSIKNNIPIPGWNHLDFVWSINAKPVMIDPVIQILNADFAHQKH